MGTFKRSAKPMYAQIADDIRYKIQNKLVAEEEKLPSEAELANHYNVSRITSQRALDELENEGLIYRVKGSGSFVARQSNIINSKNTLDMIAIILPFDSVQGGGMNILHGAQTVAGTNGYYLSFHNSQGNLMTERQIILQLFKDGVKGIVYYPMQTSEHLDLLCMLAANKYPIVMIDKYTQDIPIDSVVSDNFDGGYKITEHIIQKGHRNIIFVSTDSIDRCSSVKDRFLGYCEALKDNNIPLNIDNVINNCSTLATREWNLDVSDTKFYCRLLEYILNEKEDITCIQAVSDVIAMEIMKTAQVMGVKIPQQLSIAGFDNLEVKTISIPNITTINQDLHQMGAKGAQLVIERIKNPNKAIDNIILPVELVVKESVADINDR